MADQSPAMESQEGRSTSPARQMIQLSVGQWIVLIVMGGLLLAIGGAFVWILGGGTFSGPADVIATVVAGPTPTPTPPGLVRDALPTPRGLYWPPDVQRLATPNAPNDLLWWDARFLYRQRIFLDVVASEAPSGTWAQVIFDGETAWSEGKMRADGADLRVLVWDGFNWWEIPRRARFRLGVRGWDVFFHLQDTEIARVGHYYLYYGYPFAESAPVIEDAPEMSRLLLDFGEEESVEWGPEITWTANSTTTQTLVSPDGRIVIQSPPGGPRKDVRVKLRTVPVDEKQSYGSLPDFEFHVDPAPVPVGPSNVVHWDPPLTVIINWAGLLIDVTELENWVHFAHDENTGSWYSVAVEFDRKQGLIRMTTDQP
jgi:hypothetical protein